MRFDDFFILNLVLSLQLLVIMLILLFLFFLQLFEVVAHLLKLSDPQLKLFLLVFGLLQSLGVFIHLVEAMLQLSL